MQIPEDFVPFLEPEPARRRPVAPIDRLAQARLSEDETVRLPLSVLSFWRDPAEPGHETVHMRLNLPDNADDDVTLAGPLPDPEDETS